MALFLLRRTVFDTSLFSLIRLNLECFSGKHFTIFIIFLSSVLFQISGNASASFRNHSVLYSCEEENGCTVFEKPKIDEEFGYKLGEIDYFKGHLFIAGSGTPALRIKITLNKDDAGAEWKLRFINRNGNELLQIKDEIFRERITLWTKTLFTGKVHIFLESSTDPKGVNLSIEKFSIPARNTSKLENYVGNNDMVSLYAIDKNTDLGKVIWATAEAVVLIQLPEGGSCTGFHISDNNIITNSHCISIPTECTYDTEILFGYWNLKHGKLNPELFSTHCGAIVSQTKKDLDYVIIQTNDDITHRPILEIDPLPICRNQKETGCRKVDEIYMIQHPGGEPIQIAKKNCQINNLEYSDQNRKNDFSHSCDSVEGSSGSPIVSFKTTKNYKVIGLHYKGHQYTDRCDSGDAGCENLAKKAHLIYEDLRCSKQIKWDSPLGCNLQPQ